MKKILFTLVTLLSTISYSFSQVTITSDTVSFAGCATKDNTSQVLYSYIVNNTSSAVTVTYNKSFDNFSSMTGWAGLGICCSPNGNCYSFDGASHSFSIPAGQTGNIETQIKIDPTAVDGIGYVTVTTNYGNMTFKYTTCPTATKDFDNINFVDIYPNPASNYINIALNDKSVSSVNVMNVIGRKIAKFDVDANRSPIRIPLDNVANGVYLLQFSDAKGRLLGVKKVTKQ